MISIQIHLHENMDVFSFFPIRNSLQCPDELWFQAIATSLKIKHSVLILEVPTGILPVIDQRKRFLVNDNWSWLAPRGLSLITDTCLNKPITFKELKIFLKTAK